MMVGRRSIRSFRGARSSAAWHAWLLNQLCRGDKVRDVSFTLHRGEVLALTGLVGAGRTEVARVLFGADRLDSGTIMLHGDGCVCVARANASGRAFAS